jgi:glycosyltransferase involved in cell wall biosynthesis
VRRAEAARGCVDAFLSRVGTELGRSVAELREDPLVLRSCTFARLAELARASYLQTWFFYEPSFMAMFAAHVLEIPRGISCHVDHVLTDHAFKLVALHLATADLVLAISERTRAELIQIGGPMCANRIVVKRIGVDASTLAPQRQRFPAGPVFEAVSICRIEPKKGLHVLLEACELLRQRGCSVRVRLVGGTDSGHPGSAACAADLHQRVASANLGHMVSFENAVDHDRIADVLAASHAFIAPYVETTGGDKDGIPTSLIEAMAAGRAVVCTDAGAMLEAVTEGVEGIVVPQHDAASLADAIERLADDKELRVRLGRAAAARFDREFDSRVVDRELHTRVRQLIDRRTCDRARGHDRREGRTGHPT